MLQSYLPVIVFVGLGLIVGSAFTALNHLLGPRRPNRVKSEPYECGLPTEVTRTFRFGISFYMVAMVFNLRLGLGGELILHLAILFVTAMVAHGELARLRPSAAELTGFYLWMSFGGVLGGSFAALLAPLLFNSVAEYPLLVVAGMLCRPGFTSLRPSRLQGAALIGLAVFGVGAVIARETSRTDMVRSFFGVHRITEMREGRFRVLSHGSTIHGAQRLRQDDGAPGYVRSQGASTHAAYSR